MNCKDCGNTLLGNEKKYCQDCKGKRDEKFLANLEAFRKGAEIVGKGAEMVRKCAVVLGEELRRRKETRLENGKDVGRLNNDSSEDDA
jgi:hypothetical protein